MEVFAEFRDQDAEQVVDALRETYVRAPGPGIRSAHMAAIAAETAPLRLAADAKQRSASRLSRPPTRRFRMTPKRLALLPSALVLAFLGTAGLAVAGVTLPDTARAPFDAVGLNLPNQSRASDVHAVIDATQPGDRILGAASGGLRLCPESWLGYLPSGVTIAGLRELLRPLLELPIERVIVSHGEPVLAGGRAALARALAS